MSVDTLAIARNLRAAELPQPQAEAIAAAIGSSILETAATKADLRELRLELEAKIEQMGRNLTVWFVGSQIAVGAVIIAALKL